MQLQISWEEIKGGKKALREIADKIDKIIPGDIFVLGNIDIIITNSSDAQLQKVLGIKKDVEAEYD